MKKAVLIFLAMFLIVGAGSLFAQRATVDEFLRSYEALVVEAETLAARATITAMDLMPLTQRSLEFTERAAAIQTNTAWTLQDTTRYAALTTRYTTAMTTINNKIAGR